MFTTTPVCIAGTLFYVEDAGTATLAAYLEALHRAFPGTDGMDVRQDVEIRVAELLLERATADSVVTRADVEAVLERLGPVEGEASYDAPPAPAGKRRLFRDADAPILGGVCAGLAHRLSVAPTLVRLVFVAMIPLFGAGVFLYLGLWAALPAARTAAQRLERDGVPVSAGSLAAAVPPRESRRAWWETVLFAPFVLVGAVLGRHGETLARVVCGFTALGVLTGTVAAWFGLHELFAMPMFGAFWQFIFAGAAYLAAGVVAFGAVTVLLALTKRVAAPPRAFWQATVGALAALLVIAFGFVIRYEILTESGAEIAERVAFPAAAQNLTVAVAPPNPAQIGMRDVRLVVEALPAGAEPYAEVVVTGRGQNEAQALQHLGGTALRYHSDDARLVVAPQLDRSGRYLRESARVVVHLPEGVRLALVGGHRLSSAYLRGESGHSWIETRGAGDAIEVMAFGDQLYRVDGDFAATFDRAERRQVRQAASALGEAFASQPARVEAVGTSVITSRSEILRDFYDAARQSYQWSPDDLRDVLTAVRPIATSTAAQRQVKRLDDLLARRDTVLARLRTLPPVMAERAAAPLAAI